MRRFSPLMIVLLSMFAVASEAAPATLSLGFGASLPKDPSGQTLVQKQGPSRADGGEHFFVKLSTAKMVTGIKLTGYSTGKAGKVVIRNAVAFNGVNAIPLEGLFLFAKAGNQGKAENYNNLVRLPTTSFVEVLPNQPFTRLDIQVEAFGNNDASVLVQISFADGFTGEEYLVSRTNSDDTFGAYPNEDGYKKFNVTQLKTLMNVGTAPTADALAGQTFSCSSFSKLDPARIDFKTRAYFKNAAGELQSTSLSQGATGTWSIGAEGARLALENRNGCGAYTTYNVARKTADGNLIAEVVMDVESYIALCTAAGYDTSATRELVAYSTYPSVLDPKYAVGQYEFCRPVK